MKGILKKNTIQVILELLLHFISVFICTDVGH
jgi:hypothetical protein